MNVNIGFGGRYRAQVYYRDTDILTYDTGWFSNIITNNGLDLLGAGWSGGGVYVGTNGAAGAAGDTAITNPIGASLTYLNRANQYATAPYYGWIQYTGTFGVGAIVGTIQEVGVGPSATNLLSRSQLRDINNNPVTLTLGANDRLTITYELRQYFDLSDKSFSVVIDGATHSCVMRPYIYANSMSPQLGARTVVFGGPYAGSVFWKNGTAPFIGADWTTLPSGTDIIAAYSVVSAYVPGSYKNTSVIGMTAAQGEFGPVTAMKASSYWDFGQGVNGGGTWQISFSPAIPTKTQYYDLRLTFETTWARYP